jgi:cold shock CspA family protein
MLAVLEAHADRRGETHAEGVLEVLSDGFGFLRNPDATFAPGADDVYVSPSQIRRFGLRTGDTVRGTVRAPQGERALLRAPAGRGRRGRPRRPAPAPRRLRHRPAGPATASLDVAARRRLVRHADLLAPLGSASGS